MIKLIIFAIAAYFLYRLFANDFFRKKKADEELEKEENKRLIEKGELAQDPECGAYVQKEGSISVREGDKIWHFCSYECRDAFLDKRGGKGLNKGA